MKKIYLWSVMMGICLSFNAIAETNSLHCIPLNIKSENKEITLPGPDKPRAMQLYFFKNITEKSIWLDHPIPHPSASGGWSSYLRAGRSSVLLVNRKNFHLSCAVIQPGKVEYLDCAKVISVCESKNAVIKSSRKGTYWLAEDKPWDELMKVLNTRGVDVK